MWPPCTPSNPAGLQLSIPSWSLEGMGQQGHSCGSLGDSEQAGGPHTFGQNQLAPAGSPHSCAPSGNEVHNPDGPLHTCVYCSAPQDSAEADGPAQSVQQVAGWRKGANTSCGVAFCHEEGKACPLQQLGAGGGAVKGVGQKRRTGITCFQKRGPQCKARITGTREGCGGRRRGGSVQSLEQVCTYLAVRAHCRRPSAGKCRNPSNSQQE